MTTILFLDWIGAVDKSGIRHLLPNISGGAENIVWEDQINSKCCFPDLSEKTLSASQEFHFRIFKGIVLLFVFELEFVFLSIQFSIFLRERLNF